MSEQESKLRIYESNWQAFLLLFPALAFIAAFSYYPWLDTFWLSFHQPDLLGLEMEWVGLEQYYRLAVSNDYHYSFFITVVFAATTVTASLTLSLLISFMIFEVDRLKGFYLVAAIWPYALPLAVAGVLLDFLLHPTVGIFPYVIRQATGLWFNWHVSGRMAVVAIILAAIWQGLGYSIIFMTAALGQLPETITEAAELDGVGKMGRLFRIYLPLISPTIVFLIVIQTVTAFFGGFALVDLMTGGGPDGATNILMYKLYVDTFSYQQWGYGAAQSVVLFFIVAVMMFIQLKVTDRYAFYG